MGWGEQGGWREGRVLLQVLYLEITQGKIVAASLELLSEPCCALLLFLLLSLSFRSYFFRISFFFLFPFCHFSFSFFIFQFSFFFLFLFFFFLFLSLFFRKKKKTSKNHRVHQDSKIFSSSEREKPRPDPQLRADFYPFCCGTQRGRIP